MKYKSSELELPPAGEISETGENQMYHVYFCRMKSKPDSDDLSSYGTLSKGEIINYFDKYKNGEFKFFKVFTIPQWEEIKDAEVILKKEKA